MKTTKIKGGGEEAVGHAYGQIGDGATDLAAASAGVEQRKAEVVNAAGWIGAVIQPPLIGERRALGVGGGEGIAEGR